LHKIANNGRDTVNVKLEFDKLPIFVVDELHRPRSRYWYFHSKGDQVFIGPDATGRTAKLSFHADNALSRD
jgi:hypothetical protein